MGELATNTTMRELIKLENAIINCRFCGRKLTSLQSKNRKAGKNCINKRKGLQKSFPFATQFPKKKAIK